MSDSVLAIVGAALLVGRILLSIATDALPAVSQRLVEPLVRWLQRVSLGNRAPRTGDEALFGRAAIAGTSSANRDGVWRGTVIADAATRRARADRRIERGCRIRALARQNLALLVQSATRRRRRTNTH